MEDPNVVYINNNISSANNKGVSKEERQFFLPNIPLENLNIGLNGVFYLKIRGNFDYCAFMNNFVNVIQKKYNMGNENCFITKINENYRCDIEFQNDDEENEDNNNDLIIELHLYRSGEEELTMRFLREQGDLNEYNEKVPEIINLAKEILK